MLNKKLIKLLKPVGTSLSDKINVIGIALTAILSCILTWASCQHSTEIAKQQQQIRGFDTLLRNTYTVIEKLNKEVNLLESQLILNKQAQELASIDANALKQIEIRKLWVLLYQIQLVGVDFLKDLNKRDKIKQNEFLSKEKALLNSGLDNKYLLSDKNLSLSWLSVYNLINDYFIIGEFQLQYESLLSKGGDAANFFEQHPSWKRKFDAHESAFWMLFKKITDLGSTNCELLRKYPFLKQK